MPQLVRSYDRAASSYNAADSAFFSAALTISPSLDPSYEFRRRTGRGGVSISVFPDVISLPISK